MGERDLPGVLAIIRMAGAIPLVRVRSSAYSDIGRALDLGAEGIFIPNIRGVSHAKEVISYCRYGPTGVRSIGRLSGDSVDPVCFLILETKEALNELPSILRENGVDGIYVGPGDLALSLGKHGPGLAEEMQPILSSIIHQCVAAGVPVGVHSPDAKGAIAFRNEGATIVTAATDKMVFRAALRAELASLR
jgi:4-hydroxy-2-oxoheptanedioate aldolase